MIAPPHMVKGFSFLLVCSGTKEKRFLEENGLNVKICFCWLERVLDSSVSTDEVQGLAEGDGFIL